MINNHQVGVDALMDMIRRSFLQEVRFIENSDLPPDLKPYFEIVRRSRLQLIRYIEREQGMRRRAARRRRIAVH